MLNPLVGIWKSDSRDKKTIEKFGKVILEFSDNGKLTYTIHEGNKEQKMFLTYRIQGDTLITNQPSKPKEEETKFRFASVAELSLFFGGEESKYIKVIG
jgi:uncharacterized protein (TIGR03066 family)